MNLKALAVKDSNVVKNQGGVSSSKCRARATSRLLYPSAVASPSQLPSGHWGLLVAALGRCVDGAVKVRSDTEFERKVPSIISLLKS